MLKFFKSVLFYPHWKLKNSDSQAEEDNCSEMSSILPNKKILFLFFISVYSGIPFSLFLSKSHNVAI